MISCIMPTYNRRRFVPQAIKYFLRQDYDQKELIVVDDGTDPVNDLIPPDERIRYIRLDNKLTVGAKRNLACGEARGEIIVHWDDDDWMADWRLGYQVTKLLESKSDINGLSSLWFYDPISNETWQYIYSSMSRPWVAGGTLCYRRELWEKNPFPDIMVGEDARFVWSNCPKRISSLEDSTFYIAIIHPGNTSPKVRRGVYWKQQSQDMQSIMGQDLKFYLSHCERRQQKIEDEEPGMKLNLGCCDAPLQDYTNVDVFEGPGVDQVADLNNPWPWSDDSVDYVRAWDIIEHLRDKIFTMNELWRVLRQGGQAEIVVPTTDGSGAWQDPTHVSFWNRRSFLYYEANNPYRDRFAHSNGVRAKFKVVQERTDHSMDGPRLTIVLEAVKP
jgi:hypothetical protein